MTTRQSQNILAKFFSFFRYSCEDILEQKVTKNEMPLSSEMFSSSQMKEHGKKLAGLHTLYEHDVLERLLKRLAGNEIVLLDIRDMLIEVVKEKRPITPAGEWLLDNFYLIEEQIITAKRLLPKGYSKGLPHLKNG